MRSILDRREFLKEGLAGVIASLAWVYSVNKGNCTDIDLQTNAMDPIAESYVKLMLKIAQYDPDYVLAEDYFGPEEWKPDTTKENTKVPLDELTLIAKKLIQQLDQLDRVKFDEMEKLRYAFLYTQISSAKAKIDIMSGQKMSFDEESLALYSVKAKQQDESYFKGVIGELNKILPGQGSIVERANKFKSEFFIPEDKLHTVFTTALAEARRRTLEHIQLPKNEGVELELVKDKPWLAYQQILGNSKSLIQINTDLPLHMFYAIDLACHEVYPGHHTHSTLLEDRLMKGRKWVEFSLNSMFVPFVLIAEGIAEYGIELAFPMSERIAYEKAVLFPLAGLDSSKVEQYNEVRELSNKLSPEWDIQVARQYLDGIINRDEAVKLLIKYSLCNTEEASKSIEFFDKYKSYIISYGVGKEIISEYIRRNGGTETNHKKRWDLFCGILSTPQTPSGLQSA